MEGKYNMAWTTPKTDWDTDDGIEDTDLNRIEENTEYLYDSITPINIASVASLAVELSFNNKSSYITGFTLEMSRVYNRVSVLMTDGGNGSMTFTGPIYMRPVAGDWSSDIFGTSGRAFSDNARCSEDFAASLSHIRYFGTTVDIEIQPSMSSNWGSGNLVDFSDDIAWTFIIQIATLP
tara:strand:+ start:19011 stop:19547 length:537 start_codon:yes stop_codon:yes gene_type:complete